MNTIGVVFRTPTGMRKIDVDANGQSTAILGSTSARDFPSSISPNGEELAFLRQTEDMSGDVYVVSLRGNSQPHAVVSSPAYEGGPQFSPDGRWLAYVSNKSEGRNQVYVRRYPALDKEVPVSTRGGSQPVWNPKGGELFYRDGNKVMAVEVSTKPNFSIIRTTQLFDQPYVFYSTTLSTYDVRQDGERFVMLKDQSGSGRLNLVLNWLDELKQQVPVN
jgi:Tol biopolymer transport system component